MEVSEIIERVDILSYISQFCELEERRDGEYWGLSPLKEENTPSFSVNVEKQRFYDFSSGQGGNVLDFIRKYHNCSFMKGLQILKKYANIRDNDQPDLSRRLLATSVAKKYKRHQKKEKKNQNVVLPEDNMGRYERNDDKLSIWRDEGIKPESMERFFVRYDPFSDRIVYPIRNLDGKIINVGGRTLDKQWKEKGLHKYTYFRGWNGGMNLIYGLFDNMSDIESKREVILFEGCKSVLLADTWGFRNCGALLTSHLSSMQMKILARLGYDVVFMLDKEINIKEDRNIQRLRPYVNIFYYYDKENSLHEKDAPVDKGRDVFERLYNKRIRLR